MNKKIIVATSLLIATLLVAGIVQCVKPGESTSTSGSSSANEEPEFTLSGEAI